MRQDGELHAGKDRKGKEDLATRNEAENAVYRTERLLKESQASITDANRGRIESALNELKEALNGSPAAAIKTACEKLNEIVSTASLILGVAAAEVSRISVLVAGMAGLVAGAMSSVMG